MIHIPALDGLTQAEFPGEIEEMAPDYIAVTTETPIENVEVRRIHLKSWRKGQPATASGSDAPTAGWSSEAVADRV